MEADKVQYFVRWNNNYFLPSKLVFVKAYILPFL